MILIKIRRLFHTVRYLKPKQAYYFFRYRAFGYKRVGLLESVEFERPKYIPLQYLSSYLIDNKTIVDQSCGTIEFLNIKKEFDIDDIDWCPKETKRLWRYNLHYFDCLHQHNIDDSVKHKMINSWIMNNPQMSQPAWEPYTTSLRIINWAIYFSTLSKVPEYWQQSYDLQARWLYYNQEHHILANHFFENLAALSFACVALPTLSDNIGCAYTKDGSSFNKVYLELQHQLKEQFLGDGGHYERSPQYHAIIVSRCLSLYSLFMSNAVHEASHCIVLLEQIIKDGIHFLESIKRPDDKIPLFNDSAFDQTPSLDGLKSWAVHCGLASGYEQERNRIIRFDESGFYGCCYGNDWFLLDCGDIGPTYQPGHTHCDFLSFELVLNGQAIIVNSGVYEYEPGLLRQQMRSTKSHNTVMIEGIEQSDIWGEFRVAKRAKKLNADIHLVNNNQLNISGSYMSQSSLYVHKRQCVIHLDRNKVQRIKIEDMIKSKALKKHLTIKSYIHFHPSVSVRLLPSNRLLLQLPTGEKYTVETENIARMEIIDTDYSPEFGVKIAKKTAILTSLTMNFSYNLLAI